MVAYGRSARISGEVTKTAPVLFRQILEIPYWAVVRTNQSAASRVMVPTEHWGDAPGVGSAWREFEKGDGVLLFNAEHLAV